MDDQAVNPKGRLVMQVAILIAVLLTSATLYVLLALRLTREFKSANDQSAAIEDHVLSRLDDLIEARTAPLEHKIDRNSARGRASEEQLKQLERKLAEKKILPPSRSVETPGPVAPPTPLPTPRDATLLDYLRSLSR